MPTRRPVPVVEANTTTFLGIQAGQWLQAATVIGATITLIWTAGSWVQSVKDAMLTETQQRISEDRHMEDQLKSILEDHKRYESWRGIPTPQR